MTLDSRVKASRNTAFSEIRDEIVLVGFESGKYYGLDGVGARIWRLVQEPRTLRDVLAALLAEFEVDAAACERDLLEFASLLEREKLLATVA